MKKPAELSRDQAGFFDDVNEHDSTAPAKFQGTDNPRELRALALLLRRPSVPREVLDREAGCANGPDLVARLRDCGLGSEHLPCTRVTFIDRDGAACRPGVYSLTAPGRRAVLRWLAKRDHARKPVPQRQASAGTLPLTSDDVGARGRSDAFAGL